MIILGNKSRPGGTDILMRSNSLLPLLTPSKKKGAVTESLDRHIGTLFLLVNGKKKKIGAELIYRK